MIAVPCAFMRVSTANNRSISRFSSAAVGSSRMKTRHWRRSALAIATPGARRSRAKRPAGRGRDRSRAGRARRAPRRASALIRPGPAAQTGAPGRSPSAMFSAIDSAGTRRSSCGMVTMPPAMASRGLGEAPLRAVDPNRAAIRTPDAAQNADQRGFAGAILADDGMDLRRRRRRSRRRRGRPSRRNVCSRPQRWRPGGSSHQRGTNATCIFWSVNMPRSIMTSLSSATVQSRMGTS